jgi:hypothetical protein
MGRPLCVTFAPQPLFGGDCDSPESAISAGTNHGTLGGLTGSWKRCG